MKKQHPKNKVFIVHRLDKDTSGIVLFAKNENIKLKLQNDWDKIARERKYVTIVKGKLDNDKGQIISWLKETKI